MHRISHGLFYYNSRGGTYFSGIAEKFLFYDNDNGNNEKYEKYTFQY